MKVRRIVIVLEHRNHNAKKPTYLRHNHPLFYVDANRSMTLTPSIFQYGISIFFRGLNERLVIFGYFTGGIWWL
jgi:hypothetical protein